jgi:hypothetical protein
MTAADSPGTPAIPPPNFYVTEPPVRQPRADELRALLGTLTYKPGWTFLVDQTTYMLRLVATMSVPNSYPPHQMMPVTLNIAVPAHGDLQGWLFEQIMQVEAHEVREWFRISGRLPYGPHDFSTMGSVGVSVQWRPSTHWPPW